MRPGTRTDTIDGVSDPTRTPPAEDPQRQDCFAFDCRLVRLTFRPTTPARVDLTLATPGGGASPVNIAVNSEAACPAR